MSYHPDEVPNFGREAPTYEIACIWHIGEYNPHRVVPAHDLAIDNALSAAIRESHIRLRRRIADRQVFRSALGYCPLRFAVGSI